MNPSDLIMEEGIDSGRITPEEKAVLSLLRLPALSYLREIRKEIDADPRFLAFHSQSVGLRIQYLLSKDGIFWDQDVFEKRFTKVVMEAVARLRDAEK